MKILRIGDPHIKPTNVEEAEKLMHFVNDTILERQPDRVEIMGDLFHTHSIVRLEVLEFWEGWLDTLTSHENIDFYVLRGNHDMASDEEFAPSALLAFKHLKRKNLKICELPRVDGIYAYVSYYKSHEKFIEVSNRCAEQGAKVLICHQTFDGSRYETGIYAPDGIDATKINFNLIISGHIHTHQDMMKDGKRILYPGTPKWDTAADANEDKGIWLYGHDDATGAILSEELITTHHVVTKIVNMTWVEGMPCEPIPDGCKVTVELVGSSKWIDEQKVALKGKVSLKTKITDRVERKDRNAGKNFADFVANKFTTDLNKVELLRYMRERGIV
jgi:DNA repair exonuclease SbcCD nuclease subunit